jgi:prolipoprotein diacylglyceryl transferase
MLVSLVASIPSPSSNSISIGPIDLRAYGILIALGVLAGVWLASRRLAEDGLDPEIVPNVALWALPAAIIGARLYFVLTNWGRFSDDLASAFRLWEGGLGIPGGVALGMAVGIWWLRREKVPLPPVFTAVAVGLPLGQIIGRFGNWFNQELYGRPTDLPWGLEIDAAHRLSGYESSELFHPTFAYEILWNIALLGFLLWIDRKRVLKPGALFAVYLIGYGIGRTLIETVRIDPVNELFGIRLHIWAMVVFIAGAAVYLYRYGWAAEPALAGDGTPDAEDDADADAAEDAADADAEVAEAEVDEAEVDEADAVKAESEASSDDEDDGERQPDPVLVTGGGDALGISGEDDETGPEDSNQTEDEQDEGDNEDESIDASAGSGPPAT